MRAIWPLACVVSTLLLGGCGDGPESRNPGGPSPPGPIAPGVYRLGLFSIGTTSSCVGTSPPIDIGLLPVWGIEIELRLRREGDLWVGRSEAPGSTAEIRLRLEEGVRLTGTLQGQAEHWLNAVIPSSRGAVSVGGDAGPASLEGVVALVDGTINPIVAVGSVSGIVRYHATPAGEAVCERATWGLTRV